MRRRRPGLNLPNWSMLATLHLESVPYFLARLYNRTMQCFFVLSPLAQCLQLRAHTYTFAQAETSLRQDAPYRKPVGSTVFRGS